MASWRRITGVAGLAAGAAAAGAGAIVAAERIAVGRVRVIRSGAEPEPLGSPRGSVLTGLADDGVPLHVEIDPPAGADGPQESSPEQGNQVTIIFCHGYTLNQDSWHLQSRGHPRVPTPSGPCRSSI